MKGRTMTMRGAPGASLAAMMCVAALTARPAAAQTTTLVSRPAQIHQANGASRGGAAGPDGRFIAFASDASDLVPGDTNGKADIFLRDTARNTTRRVSIALDGSQANGPSSEAAVSADGRYVAFASTATNLLAGDSNNASDIFLRDTVTDTTQRISVSTGGVAANGGSFAPSISADGRFIAFESLASNLVENDPNGESDVFVRDIQTGTTRCVSVSWTGTTGNGRSISPSISADGAYVAFASDASNLTLSDSNNARDIFVLGLADNGLSIVSAPAAGGQSNGASQYPSISADGRWVAFQSAASNLAGNDTNSSDDVFLRELNTGAMTLISTGLNGAPANDFSFRASVSPDGRYVAFASDASNLVTKDTNNTADIFLRDTTAGTTRCVSTGLNGTQANEVSSRPAIGADGGFVVFESLASNLAPDDTNGVSDVFVRDTQSGVTARASLGGDMTQGDNHSYETSLSENGRFVAFASNASNLVPGDTNTFPDIFMRDTMAGTMERISLAADGAQGDGYSYEPSVSANGRYVAFRSSSANLVSGDTNGRADVFVRDRTLATTHLVSAALDGASGNNNSYAPSISADGRYVAFESRASNLVTGDSNGAMDVFLRDTVSGTTTCVSVARNGGISDSESDGAAVSADGRYVAFASVATNLVPDDTNGRRDIFVRDTRDGVTRRVSISTTGAEANGDSNSCAISADGRFVAFASAASNLTPDSADGTPGMFLHDTILGTTVCVSPHLTPVYGSDNALRPSISGDGRFVAFASDNAGLVPGDTNGARDVFVYDGLLGVTRRASVASDGVQGNHTSRLAAISGDGRFVAYTSSATNLAADDVNDEDDIFLRGPLPLPAPFHLTDATAALRIAGGLATATADDVWRLDVVPASAPGVDLRDAVAIAGKAIGP